MYFLAEHAHLCVRNGEAIVLDLQSGRYLGLAAVQAGSLGRYVREWPLCDLASDGTPAVQMLLARGLLTRDAARGKTARPISVPRATQYFGDWLPLRPPSIQFHHVANFLAAASLAAAALRFIPFRVVVAHVRRRRMARASTGNEPEMSAVIALLLTFERLRPLAFGRKDTCLLHTLALAEFLARYHVYPDWIFGIRTGPFAAHCWLQMHDFVLTDTPFNVEGLTPIMMV